MTDKEKTLAFIEERIKWNEDMMQRDPKPSDIGRIEEAKCIRRFIESLQEEPVNEDLEEVAKNHLWKDAQGDDLPEIDREVIVSLKGGKVAFAHRPYKGKYIGKSLTTGNIETFENLTYDKGEWNIPDVKYWLDVELPKEIEV